MAGVFAGSAAMPAIGAVPPMRSLVLSVERRRYWLAHLVQRMLQS